MKGPDQQVKSAEQHQGPPQQVRVCVDRFVASIHSIVHKWVYCTAKGPAGMCVSVCLSVYVSPHALAITDAAEDAPTTDERT